MQTPNIRLIGQIQGRGRFVEFTIEDGQPICLEVKQIDGLWVQNRVPYKSWTELARLIDFEDMIGIAEIFADASCASLGKTECAPTASVH